MSDTVQLLLSFGFVSVLVTFGVQWLKKWSAAKKFHPLVVLSILSVVGGIIYAILQGVGVWDTVVQYTIIIGTAANTIYSVADAVLKATTDGKTTLSRKS